MSIIHYIKTPKKVDFEKLTDYLADIFPDLEVLRRNKDIYYYWLFGQSTRGVDISRENRRYYEITNTVVSNTADYRLTNMIGHYILEHYGGKLYSEDEKPLNKKIIFTQEEMEKQQQYDTDFLMFLLKNEQELAFMLADRKVYFGKKAYQDLLPYKTNDKLLREKIYERMKYVWYEVPAEYEYGLIMEIEAPDEEKKKTAKLITNTFPYIIDETDYILFEKNKKELIAIPHEKIYEIKPPAWKMIDEIQFITPILPQEEWAALKKRAEQYNIFPHL